MATDFKIIAHRGASSQAPDNSMTAFRLALGYDADMIESDVQYTLDHVLVLVHDPMIQGRKVTETSLAELRQLDPNILTVSATLAHLGDRIPFCWEIKTPGIEQALITMVYDLVPAAIWAQTEFTSFDFESAVLCSDYAPNTIVGWLTKDWSKQAIDRVKQTKLRQICPAAEDILNKPDLLDYAKVADLSVRAWGVKEPMIVGELMQLGIDGCTTNWTQEAVQQRQDILVQPEDILLYQDDLIKVIVPDRPHITSEDGGHLIIELVEPKVSIGECDNTLRIRLMEAVTVASQAVLQLPQNNGGITNIQDNGNWFYRDNQGNRNPKRLHFHVYGRSPNAILQPFGEALRFPLYEDRKLLRLKPFNGEESTFLRTQIYRMMTL